MPWATAHPPGGPELTDGLRPFTGAVSDESDGFPHHTDPTTASTGGAGVPPRLLRFVVGEGAGRDQVGGNPVGALLAQPAKVSAYLQVQRVGGRPLRQVRPGFADIFFAAPRPTFGHALEVGGVPALPTVRAMAAAAVSGRWAAASVRVLTTTFMATALLTTSRRRPPFTGFGARSLAVFGVGPRGRFPESFAQVTAERRRPVGPILVAATGRLVPVADRPRTVG